jgi:hypothetical protein
VGRLKSDAALGVESGQQGEALTSADDFLIVSFSAKPDTGGLLKKLSVHLAAMSTSNFSNGHYRNKACLPESLGYQ